MAERKNVMSSNIIIITGYLAAGKSTFARRLSEAASIPCIIKDTFKSAICTSLQINSRNDSSRFSAVTFDAMMYITERLIERGYLIIIEGNFVPSGIKKTDEACVIKGLIDKFGCRLLTYKFIGNTRILYKRFVERDKSTEREQANVMFSEPTFDEFDTWCHNLDQFNAGGTIIEVDTTDFNLVNFEQHIETAQKFLLK
ncbi:MAG: ATP-binding protein [Clostridiales bacterium]|jgi:uridine kinase|nr:ATP-binding protein [Clostridiales bacterium]